MNLNKQIIDSMLQNLISENPDWFLRHQNDPVRQKSMAFELLAFSAFLEIDFEVCRNYLTGGGGDLSIDALKVEILNGQVLAINMMQAVYRTDLDKEHHFPESKLVKTLEAIRTVFNPRAAYSANPKLTKQIEEIRSLQGQGYYPKIDMVFANNGLRWNESGEKVLSNFKTDLGSNRDQINFIHLNQDGILQHLQPSKAVDDRIQFHGSALVDDMDYSRVLVGKVPVGEIKRLLDTHGDTILEKNIRSYLGLKNNVNASIRETLLDEKDKANFFFYNNGVTMTCKDFTFSGLNPKDLNVRIHDLQIINGGQTCKTIQATLPYSDSAGFEGVFVLARLYKLSRDQFDDLIINITRATNSQTPVDLRDLRANDLIQKQLEQQLKQLGYIYKRKRDNLTNSYRDTIPSSVAAEAVLATWRCKPSEARFQSKKHFSQFYDEIFQGLNASQLVIAVKVFRYCDREREKDELIRQHRHLLYSRHYLSMILGHLLLQKSKVQLNKINHNNFHQINEYLERNFAGLYHESLLILEEALNSFYGDQVWNSMDLRKLSSLFRRNDLIEVISETSQLELQLPFQSPLFG